MKILLAISLVFFCGSFSAQNQNVAVIVDEHSSQFDVVFFSKIILLFIIGVIALISFMNYQREEKS